MRIVLNVPISMWRAPDFEVELAGGRHELPSEDVKLTAALVRCIGAAAGSGVVEIIEADAQAAKILDGAVESDEDSLKVYEEAVASGVWLEGHLEDVIAQREHAGVDLLERLKDESLDEDSAAKLLKQATFNDMLLAEAKVRLAAHRGES